VLDGLVGQLRAPSRKAAVLCVELQQDPESESRCAALSGDEFAFLVQDRPVLDEFVDVKGGVSCPLSITYAGHNKINTVWAYDSFLTGAPRRVVRH
jgi:hypothetical protein